jgi:hypothetical protein
MSVRKVKLSLEKSAHLPQNGMPATVEDPPSTMILVGFAVDRRKKLFRRPYTTIDMGKHGKCEGDIP